MRNLLLETNGMKKLLVLAVAGLIGCPLFGALSDGLVAHYKFDGNADDSSGNGNNGTVHGATLTSDRFGNANGAYAFQDSKYISVRNSPSLQGVGDRVSIAAWIKPTSWDGDWMILLCKGSGSSGSRNIGFAFHSRNYMEAARAGLSVTISKSLRLGEWQHVAYSSDGATIKVYINGECVGTRQCQCGAIANSDDLQIGCDPFGGIEYFHGSMDDLRIYSRALSADEVKLLYDGQDVEATWSGKNSSPSSWTPNGNNVLRGMTGTFSGTRFNESGRVASSDPLSRLTDGAVNAAGSSFANTIGIRNGTLTWQLPSPTDLTGLRINTHWCDGGRDGINLSSVEIQQNGGSSWITLPNSAFECGMNNDKTSGDLEFLYATKLHSVFAENVTAIRFNLGTQDNSGTGFTEFEVIGVANSTADLIHRWSFNGNLSDSVGGQTAKAVGDVTTDGSQYTLTGGSHGNSYINLGANLLPKDGRGATIEIWATQNSVQNWSRIWDVGTNEGTSYLGEMYAAWTNGKTLNSAPVCIRDVAVDVGNLGPYSLSVEYHIAAVFEPQNDGTWKVRFYKQDAATGATTTSYMITSTGDWSLAKQAQESFFLGHGHHTDSNDANASYNEVRIWSRALTETELTANTLLGPNVLPGGSSDPDPPTYTITFDANGGAPTPTAMTRKEGESYGTLPTVTKNGFTFDGWYTSASGGTKVTSETKATGNVALYAHWTSFSVMGVTAQQRYPWNGLVDITVTLQGTAEDVAEVDCVFAATNSATKAALPIAHVTHVTQNGADTGSGTTWTRKYIWDTNADVGEVKIDDVALAVEVRIVAVQLWENGPYWATCNVGATKPEEYGYYFWWGDTVGYKRNASNNGWVSVKDGTGFSFSSGNCPTYGKDNSQLRSMGYIDSTGNLVSAHDAATAHLGASWRMPTDAEFSAMINNCDTEWTTINGVWGRRVKGRGAYASKSIFLPAAGYGNDSYLLNLGSYGYYWSSSLGSSTSYDAWRPYFYSGYFNRNSCGYRYNGQSVRPVRGFAK